MAAARVRGGDPEGDGSRKVGTPQGRVLANGQSGRPAGQCHREQTADGAAARVRTGKGETVRYERTRDRGDPVGSVNPTRSKVETGVRTARPVSLVDTAPRWTAQMDGHPTLVRGWTESRLQADSPSTRDFVPGKGFRGPIVAQFPVPSSGGTTSGIRNRGNQLAQCDQSSAPNLGSHGGRQEAGNPSRQSPRSGTRRTGGGQGRAGEVHRRSG